MTIFNKNLMIDIVSNKFKLHISISRKLISTKQITFAKYLNFEIEKHIYPPHNTMQHNILYFILIGIIKTSPIAKTANIIFIISPFFIIILFYF